MTRLKHVDFEVAGWGELAAAPQALASYRAAVLADNPIRYWRLGESGSTDPVDETGNNTTATYESTPTRGATGLIEFNIDTAVQFGSSSLANSQEVLLSTSDGTQPYSFEFWLTTTQSAANIVAIAQYTASEANRWQVFLSAAGAIRYRVGSTNIMSDSTSFNDGLRHHMVVTKASNGDLELWVDAVRLQTANNAHALGNSNFTFGARTTTGNGSFVGVLDEVAVYNQVLLSSRIAAHYNVGSGILTAQ